MNCTQNRGGAVSNEVDIVKCKSKKNLAYSSQIKRPHLQLSMFYTNQSLPSQLKEKYGRKEETVVESREYNEGNSYDDNVENDAGVSFKAKYQLNHPRGFRLLQNGSVIERHLHNYFRLPPAPCPTLQAEREYIRYAMRVIDAREVAARENRRTCHHHNTNASWLATTATMEESRQENDYEHSNDAHTLNKSLLMSSTKSFAPEDVTEANLQDLELECAVADDLMEFVNLHSLDVSENKLTLSDVSALPALQTLNLTCNEISSMEELHSWMSHELFDRSDIKESVKEQVQEEEYQQQSMSSSRELHDFKRVHPKSREIQSLPFAQLRTLNMSYNHIPAHHVTIFALLPLLECLDLSGNELRVLPSDLSQFTQLKQITLQYNSFTTEMHSTSNSIYLQQKQEEEDEALMTSNNNNNQVVPCTSNIFASLSTAPALIFVDVSHNKLSFIPPFHVAEKKCKDTYLVNNNISSNKVDASTLCCLPKFVHIDLSYNCFSEPTSILALAHLHQTLRLISVHHNPLCNSSIKANMTRALFDNVIIHLYYNPEFLTCTGTGSSLGQMESYEECNLDDENEEDEDSLLWHGDEWDQFLPTHEPNKEEQQQQQQNTMTHSKNMANISAAAAAAAAACYSQRASSATSSHNVDTSRHVNKNDNRCCEFKNGEQVCLNEWGEDVNEEYERLSPYKEESEHEEEECENNETCETAFHDHSSKINAATAEATHTVPNNSHTLYKSVDEYLHAFQIRLVFDDSHYCTPPLLRELYSTHPSPSYTHLEPSTTINNSFDGSTETRHAVRRLVTIPSYNEFMDIYRLVRCVPPTKRKNNPRWRRSTVPGTKTSKAYKTQPNLASEQTWEGYTEAEHQESPLEPMEPQSEQSATCTSQTTSATMESNSNVPKSEDVGFFITGVDQTVTVASHHATPYRPVMIANSHKEPLTTTTHTLPLISKSVISPSTMNVQHAMRELRMLLRKPLPPLPHTHKTRV